MTDKKHPQSFRENIYGVVVQALGYSDCKKDSGTQKQIRQWIDEELQQISHETTRKPVFLGWYELQSTGPPLT